MKIAADLSLRLSSGFRGTAGSRRKPERPANSNQPNGRITAADQQENRRYRAGTAGRQHSAQQRRNSVKWRFLPVEAGPVLRHGRAGQRDRGGPGAVQRTAVSAKPQADTEPAAP